MDENPYRAPQQQERPEWPWHHEKRISESHVVGVIIGVVLGVVIFSLGFWSLVELADP